MKVKFGFLVSIVRKQFGGTYDPVNDFREIIVGNVLKKVGDKVEEHDLIVEVATDKMTMEMPLMSLSEARSGVIASLNCKAGITWRYEGLENMGDDKMFLPELGWIETDEEVAVIARPTQDKPIPGKPAENLTERVRAAPAARKLAREAGIEIDTVLATGSFGRVMHADVERAIAERKKIKEIAKPASPAGVILLTPSREWLTVAHNLEEGSRTTIAAGEPVWRDTFDEYDLSEIRALRAEYRKEFEGEFGVPLHISAPLLVAATRALRLKDFWVFNGFWHIEDRNDRNKDMVALYPGVNMGISFDLGIPPTIDLEKKTIGGPRLRIATLHNAHELSLREFLKHHHDLMTRATTDIRSAKLQQTTLKDWTGWTFIFNNVGAARHRRGNSLFTPNMSAMLNIGVIGKDGKTPLQIFFDHRMIDGVPATLFIDAVYEELTKRVLPEIKLACVARRDINKGIW